MDFVEIFTNEGRSSAKQQTTSVIVAKSGTSQNNADQKTNLQGMMRKIKMKREIPRRIKLQNKLKLPGDILTVTGLVRLMLERDLNSLTA